MGGGNRKGLQGVRNACFYEGISARTDGRRLSAGVSVGGMSMDWISVKDRLPEDDATYLVYGRNGYGIVFAVYYGDGEWLTWADLTNITRFVTHWMPLPPPPKED